MPFENIFWKTIFTLSSPDPWKLSKLLHERQSQPDFSRLSPAAPPHRPKVRRLYSLGKVGAPILNYLFKNGHQHQN
jgi:hypothetical protein